MTKNSIIVTLRYVLQCQVSGVDVAMVDVDVVIVAFVYVAVNPNAVDGGVDDGVAVVGIMLLVGWGCWSGVVGVDRLDYIW